MKKMEKMKKILRGRWVVGLAMIAMVGRARAQDMAELEVDHALTLDFPTPHTDWAQPYAKGPVRVLFFTNGRGTAPRECVEIMQRFDIEAKAVFWTRIIDSTKEQWHGAEIGEQRMLALLSEPWDCFVFMGMDLTRLGAEAQYKVLKPVSRGAGIVFVGAKDGRVLKERNRIAELPPFLATGPVGDAYRILEGRALALPGQPTIPYAEGWSVRYDYWAERLGRAILWAAGNEPDGNLRLRPSRSVFARGEPAHLQADLTGTRAATGLKLEVRLRKPGGPTVEFPGQAIVPGTPISIPIPLLPAGSYYADAWVRGPRGIETWTHTTFTVTSERGVEAVVLEAPSGEVGGSLAGRVRLTGDPIPGEVLRIRCLDRRRRVLMQRDVSPDSTAEAFEFPVEAWLPMLVTVEARILANGREVASRYEYFRVTKRNRGQFNFLMWDTPRGTLAPYAEQSLAEHSVTLQLGHGNPNLICAAFDVAWVPYTTRIMAKLTPDGIMQPFCWNDAEAVRKHVADKAKAYADTRRHGAFVWSLGDEVDTKGACLSPYCAEAYRGYLKQQYNTLKALNESWGTSFTRWAQVGLADPADNNEAGSLRGGNYPRWFDRQAFKSWNFVQFCRKFREAYEAIDPEAKVGFEGAGRFDKGDDIDLIVRNNTFWSPYPGTADEVIRSIAPRQFPRANWMGYTKDAGSLLVKYWRMVTRGMDAVWWWRWDALGRFHGWLAPDLRPFPAVKEILADTQVVRDGLGDLLLRSTMQHDRVAVLYSFPSSLAQRLENGPTYGGYEEAHRGTHEAVRELGLQFRYVTARMLRQGEFKPGEYGLLLLPRAEALSDAAAERIRSFVENGGVVVADVRPGVFDHHLKLRERGVLDDLFGIQRPNGLPAAETTKDDAFQGNPVRVDPGVETAGGSAELRVAGRPVFIAKRTGKGLAVLLNLPFGSYPKLGIPGTDERHAARLGAWFEAADIRRRIDVRSRSGARERNVEVTRWKNGDIEFVSLFRQAGVASEAVVVLPERAVAYDLRRRKALGRRRRIKTSITPGRAVFFALLPARSPKVELEMVAGQVSRGEVANLALRVPNARGLHAFRVRVTASKKLMKWQSRNVIVGEEPMVIDLPIAFNDPEGVYSVTATDLFSGNVARAKLSVR